MTRAQGEVCNWHKAAEANASRMSAAGES